MANAEHVEIVSRGAKAIEAWRERSPDEWLHLKKADLSGADLSAADLRHADLWCAKLVETNLGHANLSGADLSYADLSCANLMGANLSHSNLSCADLVGANLAGANLTRARLSCANRAEAYLFTINTPPDDLRAADLSGANLYGANLSGADLIGANLTRANLTRANVAGADIEGADVGQATVGFGAFAMLDLSRVRGLETVRHVGPTTVGVDTLYKSRGKIPVAFLRGCGVPDGLIACLPSLIDALPRNSYCSCFISYSQIDEEFANRLHSRMRDDGMRVWHAPEHREGRISEQVEEATGRRDLLLLVLSETSMNSKWLPKEIYHARQREEEERRRILFPIGLVPFEAIQACKWPSDMSNQIALEIRQQFVSNFSNWKDDDSFEAAFKRLLGDLKAHDLVPSSVLIDWH